MMFELIREAEIVLGEVNGDPRKSGLTTQFLSPNDPISFAQRPIFLGQNDQILIQRIETNKYDFGKPQCLIIRHRVLNH